MHYSVCDFLLDIIQNSIEAESGLITLLLEEDDETMTFKLMDNGRGMTAAELAKVKDPFYTDGTKHKSRKIGLGIPFLVQAVEQIGGTFSIESEKGVGTTVSGELPLKHIDVPPFGDFPATLLAALTYPGDHELVVRRSLKKGTAEDSYEISRQELKEVLGEFITSGAQNLLHDYLISQENELENIRNNRDV